jgi:cation:H+ antiporter
MVSALVAVIGGFLLLVWSADRFVLGASSTARNLGVSTLVIGLTIVGFGTSAPEMMVSAIASWNGNSALAIGNAIGSNIANIAMVLGISALCAPLVVRSDILQRELPIMIFVMLFALALMLDADLSRGDGLMLLFGMCIMIYWVTMLGLRTRGSDPILGEFDIEIPRNMPMQKAVAWLVVGMIMLFVSSKILVWGAVTIAQFFGVSDLVIGLTVIAIGTSLPELAASVMSAIKNEHDLAIGNVIGSNMFNLLGVLAMPGLISPGRVPAETLTRDYPVMIGVSIALFIMAYGFRGHGRINRPEAAIMLMVYILYLFYLYHTSSK